MADCTFLKADALAKTKAFPDLLKSADGGRIQTPEEWTAQRERLKEMVAHYMYGAWPECVSDLRAEVTMCEIVLDGHAVHEEVTLRFGDGNAVSLDIMRPNCEGRVPVITFNNMPGRRCPIEDEVIGRGYAIAMFNRHDIVPDVAITPAIEGKKYPDLPCSTIMAWGFGHAIVAEYLATRAFTGPLAATGHSRGGKAALCAGIFDERFQVVAPINSGCGGAGALRFLGTLDGARQDPTRVETVGAITHRFPDWFTPEFMTFGSAEPPYPVDPEEKLPFDAHTLRALVAPRYVMSSEGEEDDWANPVGTMLARDAAQAVFDLLGVPDGNQVHLRPGKHMFGELDWRALMDFCDTCPEMRVS